MEKESVEVCNNWQEMPEFTDCISALDALPSDIKDEAGTKTRAGKETTNDQMEQFFKVYSEVAIQNFAIWKKNTIPRIVKTKPTHTPYKLPYKPTPTAVLNYLIITNKHTYSTTVLI